MNHLHQVELAFSVCGLVGCILSAVMGYIGGWFDAKRRYSRSARQKERDDDSPAIMRNEVNF